jgi:predicted RNA methylase
LLFFEGVLVVVEDPVSLAFPATATVVEAVVELLELEVVVEEVVDVVEEVLEVADDFFEVGVKLIPVNTCCKSISDG